jgi:hypothetical protein
MQIYFSPELIKPDAQVLNVVDQNGKAVGYVAYIVEEKKMYVYGHLEDDGVRADFKDLIQPYLKGLKNIKEGIEVYSYLSVGGEKMELKKEEDEEK